MAGAGGVGVMGANLTVINGGSIRGGLSGGLAQADAILFTGGTNSLTLQAGTTIIGNVVAFSAADTLALGGSANSSFDVSTIGASAQYQGFGVFQKTGSSTWTLTGTNTAALPWTVNAGTLAVNGTMTNSTMTANSGGTLAGTGTVGATQINSGGTFAPGSGTPGSSMTVAGNLAFQSGAVYLVQINPSSTSFATVSGTASLAGSVSASFAAGSYVAKQYTILELAGLGGTTFSGLSNTNLPAAFTDTLSYNTDDVFLNLSAALGAGTPLNPNQQNVANALNTFFNNGGALPPNFVSIFGLTGPSLQNALTQLSGENATDSEKGAFQFMTEYLSLMLDPFANGRGGSGSGGGASGFAPEQTASFPPDVALAYNAILKAPPKQTFEQRWTAWGASFGGYNKTDGDPTVGSNTVTARDFGFAGGMDYHFSPDTLAGFSLGRRRHQLGTGARSRRWQERRLRRRRLRQDPIRPLVSRRRARLRRSPVHHQPHRVRRSTHRQLQRPELWRPRRDRLPLCGAAADRPHALRRRVGAELPHAELHGGRCHRRRFWAELQRHERDRHPQRTRHALRRSDDAQRHAADLACAHRVGTRLG